MSKKEIVVSVKGSKKPKRKNATSHPSDGRVAYTGPIHAPGSKQETEMFTVNFGTVGSVTSNVGGIMALVYSCLPNTSADWTSAIALYDEYRVLGMELKFFPNNRYSKVTTTVRAAVVTVDRDDTTVPTSYLTQTKKASAKLVSLEDPWTITAKMNGIEDAGFITTATSVTAFSFKLYSDGLTVSTEFGLAFIEYLVQFRGRGTV